MFFFYRSYNNQPQLSIAHFFSYPLSGPIFTFLMLAGTQSLTLSFFTGTITTITTFYTFFSILLNYPEVQDRIHEEVLRVLGPEQLVSVSDKSKMPYTHSCLLELFRFSSILPMAIPHHTTEDTQVGGYPVAKDTPVSIQPIKSGDRLYTSESDVYRRSSR